MRRRQTHLLSCTDHTVHAPYWLQCRPFFYYSCFILNLVGYKKNVSKPKLTTLIGDRVSCWAPERPVGHLPHTSTLNIDTGDGENVALGFLRCSLEPVWTATQIVGYLIECCLATVLNNAGYTKAHTVIFGREERNMATSIKNRNQPQSWPKSRGFGVQIMGPSMQWTQTTAAHARQI